MTQAEKKRLAVLLNALMAIQNLRNWHDKSDAKKIAQEAIKAYNEILG